MVSPIDGKKQSTIVFGRWRFQLRVIEPVPMIAAAVDLAKASDQAHDNRQSVYPYTRSLCTICSNALSDTTQYDVTRHHTSLKSLQSSVKSRCHLCSLIKHFLPTRPPHQLDEYMSLSLIWNDDISGTLLCGWRHGKEPFTLIRTAFLSNVLKRYYTELIDESPSQKDVYSSFASSMLSRCASSHSICWNTKSSWSPSRLIQIRQKHSGVSLRLVEGVLNEPYVALSHCWGSAPPFKLLRQNHAQMKRAIPFIQLPKTFKDAIIITTWLRGLFILKSRNKQLLTKAEVKYIWIDSCCIIQDSTQDWLEESALMGNVYRNSFCTIAADASEDSSGGCIMKHDPLIIKPCEIETARGSVLCLPSKASLQEKFEKSPLEQRAWALQERILSPRVLHCTKEQLFWECNGEFSCQSYPFDLTSHGHFQKVPRLMTQLLRADLLNQWNGVIEDYCKRSLTKEEDKLVALSGIAKAFQPLMANDVYLAGLWYKSLPHALLWNVVDASATRRPTSYRAPSWSWAAIDGRIQTSRLHSTKMSMMKDTCQTCLDILGSDLELVSEDNTGQVRGGSLKARGLLKRGTWSTKYQRLLLCDVSTHHDFIPLEELKSPKGLSFYPDTEGIKSSLDSTELYCLIVEVRHMAMDGLVIRGTATPDHFQRVGTFHAAGSIAFDAVKYDKRHGGHDSTKLHLNTTPAMDIKPSSKPTMRVPASLSWTFLQSDAKLSAMWDLHGDTLQTTVSGSTTTPWTTQLASKKTSYQYAISWRSSTKTVHAAFSTVMTDPSNIYLVDSPEVFKQYQKLETRVIWLV